MNSSSVAVNRTLNISGGTVDLDILTLGSGLSISTRLIDISGGTVNIGALSTGCANRCRIGLDLHSRRHGHSGKHRRVF